MPYLSTRPALLLATLATVAACGGSADERAASEAARASAPTVTAADLHCWLREGAPPPAERPSPLGETVLTFGAWEGKLCYGRPSARERQVPGGLVPYGETWRLGANEATTLHVPFPARIGTVDVEPGAYTIYVMANEGQWEVFVNGATDRWGVPISEEVRAADLGSFLVPVQTADSPVETLTISWAGQDETTGSLVVEWDVLRVPIPVERRGD